MEAKPDSQEVQHSKKRVKAPRRLTKSRMEAEKDSQEVQHIENKKKRSEDSPKVGWRQERIPKKLHI